MWSTEYVELKRIDELLHCGICYEYMDTSVITSCSHSYCSLCIRKYLHYKTQCPICSEETFEKDLRKNKLLDEIIVHYLNFKEKHNKKFHCDELLTVKNENSVIVCSTNNFEHKKEQDVLEVSCKSSDSATLADNITPRRQMNCQQDVSTPSTSTDPTIPLMFTPKRKDFQKEEDRQIVTCPVCRVEVPQNNINRHLDDCLKRENTNQNTDQPKKNEQKRKPLPKLVLSLMKDNIIRKRLKQLGLSSQGDRKALESRLQRYTVLYNAECDRTYPRPISELIKQCEEEENLEKKVQKPLNKLNVNRNSEHNVIEQQRKKYLATNKDSFDQLIARIKHDNGQKTSARRNILNEENSDDISYNDHVAENGCIKDGHRTDFVPLNSINYIEDSDSSTSCPLQSYSNENPTDFLIVELESSSNDSMNQCASNHILCHLNTTSPDSFNSVIKTENIKKNIKKVSSENILVHKEIISNNQSGQYDVLENKMNIDIKISDSELMETENEEQTRLSNWNRSGTKYSSDKHVADSEPGNRLQKELYNENIDSIVENSKYFIEDSDNIDIQDDYERSKHKQLNKAMEEYTSGTKSEKENVKTLDKNLTTWALRKREHEFALSDEEKSADRVTARKSLRLGLSEAKGFNNESFGETARDEEKSQSEKEQSQVIRTNNIRNFARKSVRLKNKMSNDIRKLTT